MFLMIQNIGAIMGLQATATKRKIVDLEKEEGDQINSANEFQSSPPKITKLSNGTGDEKPELSDIQIDGVVENGKVKTIEAKPDNTSDKILVGKDTPTTNVEERETNNKNRVEERISEPQNSKESPSTIGSPSITTSISPIVGQIVNPVSSQPIVIEDSIAKLEQVAVPGEILTPWSNTNTTNGSSNAEPPIIVDSISRLQAVAVPGETWGSDSTRSALATTLLTTDDLCEDDDDDFDDDFDDDDPTIIPSYLPPRYHHCQPPMHRTGLYGNSYTAKLPLQQQHHQHPPSTHHYYTESYPQAPPSNCSRSQLYSNSVPSNRGYNWSNGNSLYYGHPMPESNGSQQQTHPPQQTIRCAENGKSYLELGSATPTPPPIQVSASPSPYLHPGHHMGRPHPSSNNNNPNSNSSSVSMKRCCDGRTSNWCNSNSRQCYKDRRLSMLNLSMFKLSRFRQVSERSLYRSVLICNTLKYIEREIEMESKEAARQHHHHQQQQQQQHHHHMMQHQIGHHSQQQHHPMHSHHNSSNTSGGSPPVNIEQYNHHHYSRNNSQFTPVQHHHSSHTAHHSPQHFSSQSMDMYEENGNSTSFSMQNSFVGHSSRSNTLTPIPVMPFNDSLPPYDHHPLRESNGRATPFPMNPNSTPTSTTSGSSSSSTISDSDSGFGDEDCTKPINWGSVLSLSSQSALDPLNTSDLFATSATTPLTPITPVQILTSSSSATASLPPSSIVNSSNSSISSAHQKTNQRDPEVTSSEDSCDGSENTTQLLSIGSSNSNSSTSSNIICGNLITTTATSFSFPSSGATTTTTSSNGHWDYSLLDMDLGLGPELTELLPSWKLTPLSADDILRSVPSEPSRVVLESEMDSAFTHIMVGS